MKTLSAEYARSPARANALGDLALEHQDHPPDRAAHLVEAAQNRRGGVKRQVADYLDRRPLNHFCQLDFEKIAADHAHRRMSRKCALEPLGEPRVQLDQP